MQGVYLIYEKSTHNFYIGSSSNIKFRLQQHAYKLSRNEHYNKYLQRSYNKYGKNNFVFVLLEEVRNKNKLIEREQFWIDHYESFNDYNYCPEAYSCMGRIVTEQHKKRIADALKKYVRTPEHARKIIEGNKKSTYVASKETREKLSQSCKGRKQSDDHIRHRVEARKKSGRSWHSEETKKKICGNKGNTGKKFTREHREKISQTRKKLIQEGVLIKGRDGRFRRRQ